LPGEYHAKAVSNLFGWLGFIHIAASLAISSAQPSWIINLFKKADRTVASAAEDKIRETALAGAISS